MGPNGRHVASLHKNVKEHVSSTSFADGVSCTTVDWLQRSHRAVKSRQDKGSLVIVVALALFHFRQTNDDKTQNGPEDVSFILQNSIALSLSRGRLP